MSITLSRRGLLRFAPKATAIVALNAIAPAPATVEVEKIVEVEAPWSSEWPPTALPGKLGRASFVEDPCTRCGGRHEFYTIRCTPILFVPDEYGNETVPGTGDGVVPPEGMHVIELSQSRARVDGSGTRYAVVRHQKG